MKRETTIARNQGFDYLQVKGKMCKPGYEPGPLTCSRELPSRHNTL